VKRAYLAAGLLAIGLVPLVGAVIVQATKESKKQQPGNALTPPSPYRGGTPPPGIQLPGFALRSYRGNIVSTRALRGKVVLVTFLDTKCTEKCPIIASQIGAALPLLPASARRQVVALAVSVDPRVDSPGSVRRFLRRRHALGKLDFLLGSVKDLRPVWHAFHILAAADTGHADIHSADARIFDRRGIWVTTLHPGVDLTPQNLAHDLRAALKRSRS
jgi:cytochrome oxidase Cu insertion factor (SCO1/SenC/PrrC family)